MERDSLWERAVLASEVERICVTPEGLAHWLVSDVASGIASANGLAEEAAWLRDLPIPKGLASPPGANEVLERVGDRAGAVLGEVWNETNERQQLESGFGNPRPYWLEVALAATSQTGLWVGVVRRARAALFSAYTTAALRDRGEELRGIPVEEGGWLSTWLGSVQMDLWDHARQLTYWPLTAGDDPGSKENIGLIVGGNPRWWPDDAPQAESVT